MEKLQGALQLMIASNEMLKTIKTEHGFVIVSPKAIVEEPINSDNIIEAIGRLDLAIGWLNSLAGDVAEVEVNSIFKSWDKTKDENRVKRILEAIKSCLTIVEETNLGKSASREENIARTNTYGYLFEACLFLENS